MKKLLILFMLIILAQPGLALFGFFEKDIIVASINLQEGSNINLDPDTITGFGKISLVDEPVIEGNLTILGDLILRDRVLSIVDQEFNASILPTADDQFDVGSAVLRWMDGFFSGTVTAGNFVGSIDHSLDDAYDDGSVIQVDDTNVTWNIDSTTDLNWTIQSVIPTDDEYFAAHTISFNLDFVQSGLGIKSAAFKIRTVNGTAFQVENQYREGISIPEKAILESGLIVKSVSWVPFQDNTYSLGFAQCTGERTVAACDAFDTMNTCNGEGGCIWTSGIPSGTCDPISRWCYGQEIAPVDSCSNYSGCVSELTRWKDLWLAGSIRGTGSGESLFMDASSGDARFGFSGFNITDNGTNVISAGNITAKYFFGNGSLLNFTSITTDNLLVKSPPAECPSGSFMTYTNMSTSICVAVETSTSVWNSSGKVIYLNDTDNTQISMGTKTPQTNYDLTVEGNDGTTGISIHDTRSNSGDTARLYFSTSLNKNTSKSMIFHVEDSGFGRGDLVFAIDNSNNNNIVNEGDEIMRIDRIGRVSIGGDASPDATLEIIGNLMISSTSSSNGDLLIVTTDGKVGIGTSTPQATLHINSTTTGQNAISIMFDSNSSSSSPIFDMRIATTRGALRMFASPNPTIKDSALQIWGLNSSFPGQIYFDSGSQDNAAIIFRTGVTDGALTERMRIKSSGEIGIGTASPQYLLQIANTSNAVNLSGILYVDGDTGYVGIRTETPKAALHINETWGALLVGNTTKFLNVNHVAEFVAQPGSSLTPAVLIGGGGSMEFWKDLIPTKALAFGMSTPGESISNDMLFSIYDGLSWQGRMVINSSNGFVGIGTLTPKSMLEVRGNTTITGAFLNITGVNNANPTIWLNNSRIFNNGSGICIGSC